MCTTYKIPLMISYTVNHVDWTQFALKVQKSFFFFLERKFQRLVLGRIDRNIDTDAQEPLRLLSLYDAQ